MAVRRATLVPAIVAAGLSIAVMSTARAVSDWKWATESAVWIAILLLAGVVGFAFDDVTEPTLAAVPTTLLQRRLALLIPALGVVGAGWVTVSFLSAGQAGASHGLILATLTFAGASASATIARRVHGRSAFGSSAAVLVVVLVVSRLPGKWEVVPVGGGGLGWAAATGWLAAGLIFCGVFLVASRDPGRPASNR